MVLTTECDCVMLALFNWGNITNGREPGDYDVDEMGDHEFDETGTFLSVENVMRMMVNLECSHVMSWM